MADRLWTLFLMKCLRVEKGQWFARQGTMSANLLDLSKAVITKEAQTSDVTFWKEAVFVAYLCNKMVIVDF